MKTLRYALRSLLHFRTYSVINVVGLALSLTCVVIIARYIHGELTVDRFHRNLERIFVTTVEQQARPGEIYVRGVGSSSSDAEAGMKDPRRDPRIELHSKFMVWDQEQVEVDGRKFTVPTLATDSMFMTIMDYPILRGEEKIRRPEGAFVTEALGKRLFGGEDPLGKTFTHSSGNVLTVVGILGRPPGKSNFPFEMILNRAITQEWSAHPYTLVLLHPNTDYRAFNGDYSEYGGAQHYQDASRRYQLLPLDELYFSPSSVADFNRGNRTTLGILALVGFMILLIGVVNFINIYTAVVLRRGREFGMKKVFGAGGGRIFLQLLVENICMIGLALLIALAMVELLNPLVRNILNFDQLPFRRFDMTVALGLLIVIPLITSVFPYLRYNYTAPITSLRSVGKTGGKSATRQLFLAFQYVVTLVMIIASIFFVRQLHTMLRSDLGFRTEEVVQATFYIPPTNYARFYGGERNREFQQEEYRKEMERVSRNLEEVKRRMDESTLFSAWTFGFNPVKMPSRAVGFQRPGDEKQEVLCRSASEIWMKIFDIRFLVGSPWEEIPGVDEEKGFYPAGGTELIVTESALKLFGYSLADYTDATLTSETVPTHYSRGETRSSNGETFFRMEPVFGNFRIRGVVKDIRVDHLSKEAPTMIFTAEYQNADRNPVVAAIMPGKRQEAIEFLRGLHADTFGGDFQYSFVEDDVHALYREDRKVAFVYSIFTIVAILISALGLFSMSLYDVQQRYREIAIRKVNGATTGIIIGMLLKRYLYLLLVSFAISVPVAWFLIRRYLEDYAHKAALSWWIYAAALGITAGISLLTLIRQTRKAANTNPAVVIRSE